jgi:hypothetical protein
VVLVPVTNQAPARGLASPAGTTPDATYATYERAGYGDRGEHEERDERRSRHHDDD